MNAEAARSHSDSVVQVRDVWKIFGDRSNEVLAAIRKDNLSKAEVLERFESVVGVQRNPAAAKFLSQVNLDPSVVNGWILQIGRDKEDPQDVAEAWVEENMDIVKGWIE